MSSTNESKRKIEHWQMISALLVVYDMIAAALSFFAALWFRYDCRWSMIDAKHMETYLKIIPLYAVICIVVFAILHLYQSVWRFASYSEMMRVIAANLITFFIHIALTFILGSRMPISYYIGGIAIQFILTLGIRFSYRFLLVVRAHGKKRENKTRSAIYGGGSSGQMLFKEIKYAKELDETLCCFFDDNKNKWGRTIDGIPIAGGRDAVLDAVKKYGINKIYIAMPSATAAQKREVINICSETGCELMTLPGIYQLTNGEVSVSSLKEVSIEDLLGRDPIKLDMNEVFAQLNGKTVLVTGGGGSIGSELCRQIAVHGPKKLIIFDVYENNAYDIQLELKKNYPEMALETLIGSVRDSRRLFQVFEEYRPDIVYHAAAHKHVPLMEDSPCEAVKNNVVGTYKTAYAALVNGCEKFVLISTDKAVNPTNVMGASKRLCEMIIQAFDCKVKEGKADQLPRLYTHGGDETFNTNAAREKLKGAKTEFVAVRFGNVLGSNGSVIPIFKKQIEKGGPVTVTHPDIIRYFMTIPEAVSLVLTAGTYAKGGEIFVLDMGEPVKIADLARNLIRLSGLKPGEDIEIVYTGLRPGEKLYEEKLMSEEGLKKTENDMIYIGSPMPFDIDAFIGRIGDLMTEAYKNQNSDKMKEYLQKVVNTYHPA